MANKRKKNEIQGQITKKGGSVNQKAVFLPFGKSQIEATIQQIVSISS